jgi:hypothetical protein
VVQYSSRAGLVEYEIPRHAGENAGLRDDGGFEDPNDIAAEHQRLFFLLDYFFFR